MVKQGCSMIPILSNLFQNDIHDIFNDTDCDPVKLYETHFNSISWADDLLLLSCSREGLIKISWQFKRLLWKMGFTCQWIQDKKPLFSPSLSGRQENSITGIQRLNVWNQSNILVSTYHTILTSKSRSKIGNVKRQKCHIYYYVLWERRIMFRRN